MKKWVYIVFLFLVIFSFNSCVLASSGGLKKDSIKTCPDGVTYGYHGSDKHWHVAENKGSWSDWSALGEPLPGDPCPEVKSGKSSESSTTHIVDSGQNNTSSDSSMGQGSNNSYSYKETTNENNESPTTYEVVSEQTSISTSNKDEKLKPLLVSLYVNNYNVSFDSSNIGESSEFSWTKKISIKYTLSSNDYNFKLLDYNNNEIKDLNDIKINNGDNNYKIFIYDNDGNSIEYSLIVTRYDSLVSILSVFSFIIIFIVLPVLLIRFIVKKIKKKR